jgi:hypothetical protein
MAGTINRTISALLNKRSPYNKDYFKPSYSQQKSMDSFLGRINKPTGGPGYKVRLDDDLSPPKGDVSGTMAASDSVAQPLSPEAQAAARRRAAGAGTARQQGSSGGDLGYSRPSSGLGGDEEELV